jgi:hypothetical protein
MPLILLIDAGCLCADLRASASSAFHHFLVSYLRLRSHQKQNSGAPISGAPLLNLQIKTPQETCGQWVRTCLSRWVPAGCFSLASNQWLQAITSTPRCQTPLL